MKNIPLGGNKEYVMQLTHSIRKVVYAMSWAAFIFLNDINVFMSSRHSVNLHCIFICIL